MTPIKICFVGRECLSVLAPGFEAYPVGGEQVQQTLLARAFHRQGYKVSMVVADYGQPDGAIYDGITTHKTYASHAGLPVLRFIHPRWTRTWAALARADADIYYTSCAGMEVGLLGLFCRRHGRRYVYRIASDADCAPETLRIRFARDRKLYEYGLRRADAILAQTAWQQARLQQCYGLESVTANMLVDTPARVYNGSGRDIELLWVSNIQSVKRPDLILDLATRLPQHAIHMIGGPIRGQEGLYETIRAGAQRHPNIVFHGALSYPQANELYARARLFINSSDLEGFPNSYLQAWVRGTPVLARFDPDGLIASQQLGAACRDVDEMAHQAQILLHHPSAWEAASRRCTDYMAREYDEARLLRPYRETFQRLCATQRVGI